MTYKLLIALAMAAAITLAVLLIGGGTTAMARFIATPTASSETGPRPFCTAAGGTPVMRSASRNINAEPLELLGKPVAFCEFTGGAGADEGSSISILAESLASENPTLAAMTYLQPKQMPAIDPPADTGTPGAMTGMPNPASIYCEQAGGIEGSYVAADLATDDPGRVITMCVFPDRSAIDSWGIAYHAMNSIRGADLAPLFAWKP
ncbi:MAG: DUF333 domain-containing protein [Thermomicrobiales bacterium]